MGLEKITESTARDIEAVLKEKGATALRQGEVRVFVLSAKGGFASRARTGKSPSQQALRALMVGVDVAAELAVHSLPAVFPVLAGGEAALLDAAGLIDEWQHSDGDPLERTRIGLEVLLRQSLSVEQAAAQLKVSKSRLRQRLLPSARTLYGIKDGVREWRIPLFQFGSKTSLVRNIGKVFPRVNPDVHPLTVFRWFTSPHQDLVTGEDDERVTPIAWLEAGNPASVVAELAAEI